MSKDFKFERLPTAHPNGGFHCIIDEETAKKQKGIIWDILKQVGFKLTSFGGHGDKDIINVSFPVRLFEPRSYLERITDGWWGAPLFLRKAAEAKDPLERFKWVMTFAVSGFHATCVQLKPFNPILGETFQANYEDGTQVFCEQSSHHPPITNWEMVGPDGLWHFYGFGEWCASIRGNSVRGLQKGPHFVEFRDGTVIKYTLPEANVRGMIWGDRVIEYEGTMKFRDKKNSFKCDLHLNPKHDEGGIFGLFKSKPSFPSDYLRGTIVKHSKEDSDSEEEKEEKKKESLGEVEGTWMGCIEFDGNTFWSFKEEYTKVSMIVPKKPLPSDCRYRKDLSELKAGDQDSAQEWKHKLEHKQRKEATLRKDGVSLRKKRKEEREKKDDWIVKRPPVEAEASSSGKKKRKKKNKKKKKAAKEEETKSHEGERESGADTDETLDGDGEGDGEKPSSPKKGGTATKKPSKKGRKKSADRGKVDTTT